tara:strand:+ start:2031 stop:2747 length:717 start_codon:yes stop_codon:yes gene_type:complete
LWSTNVTYSGDDASIQAFGANRTYLEVSAYFSDYIICHGAYNYSDRRIKDNITEINDDVSLKMLRDISCCKYGYIDKINKGANEVYGFIAQQVKEIFPPAINLKRGFIPSEYRLMTGSWNGLDMSCNLIDVSGIKYRFYVTNDLSGCDFKKIEIVGNSNNTFTFDASYNYVFCYGKEVDDFHTLDKLKLFALNFSATQEIDKIQQEEKTKLAAAEAKIASLETQLAQVLARLDSLENN